MNRGHATIAGVYLERLVGLPPVDYALPYRGIRVMLDTSLPLSTQLRSWAILNRPKMSTFRFFSAFDDGSFAIFWQLSEDAS